MKVAYVTTPGGPEVLELREQPDPQPGPGQVRVRVRAAGVQPIDLAIRSGWRPGYVTDPLPPVPGNEFAGVIDAAGDGATEWQPGMEVLGFNFMGCYAEQVVVGGDQIVHKPKTMPWEVAGGFTAGAQTAEMAWEELAPTADDVVLVHAAAGNVGGFAVQLARLRGARVIGTARPENHDYLRELGAEPVDYRSGLVDQVRALAPGGVDVVLDGAGREALDATVELAKDLSRTRTLYEHERGPKVGVATLSGARSAARLDRLVRLYADGRLTALVRSTYPLGRAADAHRELEAGHGRGKIVLTMA
ncbi:NADP-dependent oxidoreductase [Phytoactinopolyspora limicola]|uniref:NADP-dependent oxidoreductase n=1 Tax=Phytoactinopolyspora limicola TaxID=2715536 RepID=UPI00140939A1|nr:NADP-dependent oxidoreductase [Phytoactinopolyspora limicola]